MMGYGMQLNPLARLAQSKKDKQKESFKSGFKEGLGNGLHDALDGLADGLVHKETINYRVDDARKYVGYDWAGYTYRTTAGDPKYFNNFKQEYSGDFSYEYTGGVPENVPEKHHFSSKEELRKTYNEYVEYLKEYGVKFSPEISKLYEDKQAQEKKKEKTKEKPVDLGGWGL